MKIVSAVLLFAAFSFVAPSLAKDEKEEKCYRSQVDPSLNRNDNKPGTACYRQMAKVRKLEFDPYFDCRSSIRKSWEREIDIADKMGCKL